MKLINTWEDSKYNASNFLYELPKGTRVLHSKDPKTIDTKLSITINAGSHFEHLINVPEGTAHFLEHILAGDTNKYFKSKKQTDNFEYGNKKRSTVYSNASTSRKSMNLYTSTNSLHEDRAGKRLLSMIDFPIELAEKKIEKERKIIIAERNESAKRELSPQLHYLNLIFKDQKPEYIQLVLGEVETIKKISTKDLAKFHQKYFNRNNLIISVQSSKDISKKLLTILEQIDATVPYENGITENPSENFVNSYRYDHYQEPKAQGIYVELGFLQPSEKTINYVEEIEEILSYRLISKLMFDIMREKKGYIYSSDRSVNNGLAFKYSIRDLSFNCAPKDLTKALDELYKIIFHTTEKYATSKDGLKWFDNEMSRLIFPPTVNYNEGYAENKAYSILQGYEIWDHEKAVEVAMKITPKDIIDYIKKKTQQEKLFVWLYSSLDKDEVYKMYEKSEIHKHFSV